MKMKEARELGRRIAALVQAGEVDLADGLLVPVLSQRTPFRLLDLIGEAVGGEPVTVVDPFLDRIAAEGTEGGWVIIASALRQRLDHDPAGAFARCRAFVVAADVWYATDILGERVPGPALVADFELALDLLAPWREDQDAWVRRTVGVAAHFWAKRSRGAVELTSRAETLLAFLEPMFEEWDVNAVKGVGWGLKTLGRHYPDLVADWVARQVVQRQRKHRALMVRKAVKYLSEEQRRRALGEMENDPCI